MIEGRSRSPIAVAYPASIDEELVRDFVEAVELEGYPVAQHPVPDGMEYRAAIEWLMPTLLVIYVAKGYFDGFLQAAGADHYKIFKNAAGHLLQSASKLRPIKSFPRRDRPSSNLYSSAISIVFSIDGETFKLLFYSDASESEICEAMSAFLRFAEMKSCGAGVGDMVILRKMAYPGAPRLLTFSKDDGKLREIDPLEEAQQGD